MVLYTGGLLLIVEAPLHSGSESCENTTEYFLLSPDPGSVGVTDLVRSDPDVHLYVEIHDCLEERPVSQPDVLPPVMATVQPDQALESQVTTLLKVYCKVSLTRLV